MSSREPAGTSRRTRTSKGRRETGGASPWHDAFHRLRRNRLAMLGGGILLLLILASALAPWIAPFPFDRTELGYGAKPPT